MLKIHEIYQSIQGESSLMGMPCVFVRLAGCPLRCRYCDTPQAWNEEAGRAMSIDETMEEVSRFALPLVLVTGGEPLAQAACIDLLQALVEAKFNVQLETSGAYDIAPVPPSVQKILDIKTPGSGEVERNLWSNLALLQEHDEIKFVLRDREDYLWCRQKIESDLPDTPADILLSPAWGELEAAELAAWILEDRLPVRLNLQLHKIIWGDDACGV